MGGRNGVDISGAAGTVVNYGSISATGTSGSNFSPYSDGVALYYGGSVTNAGPGSITGGVAITGTLINDGSIAGGVELGGSVTSAASALLEGNYGVDGSGTVVNYGSIIGAGTNGEGIYLDFGGTVVNAALASISGDTFGVNLYAGGTLTNAGTIIGNAGTGVYFGGTASNLLVLDPGYGLSGIAMGGTSASNMLELASGASAGMLSGLGTEFVNFGQTTIDAGASWVFTDANTIEPAPR